MGREYCELCHLAEVVGHHCGDDVRMDAKEPRVAMGFVLTDEHFSKETEAYAEIAERGWHALALAFPADENEFHWHDFDAVTFILEGTLRVEFEDGAVMRCGAGARVESPAGVVHCEVSPAYRAVIGFSVDPALLTDPVNKPLLGC